MRHTQNGENEIFLLNVKTVMKITQAAILQKKN